MVLEHTYKGLGAWYQAQQDFLGLHPEVSLVIYRGTDKDTQRLVRDLCGDCDGGPLCHTDYSSSDRTKAGTWQGVQVYRGARISHFEGIK